MNALKDVFERKRKEGAPALVTFVTAGYPTADDTVSIMLAMQEGGADIIELGVPFSDPVADGPAIQETNAIAVSKGASYATCLGILRHARIKGLIAPVLFMGYYNSVLAYGEEKAIRDASDAGASGFIIVDLPPEEAIVFRERCADVKLSYVPLIAPSTSMQRVKYLSSIADSFIYIVSKMGTTGSSIHGQLNAALPDILRSIRQHATIPLAVGFGVATRRHFEVAAEAGADGIVIGSRLVTIIKESSKELLAKNVEAYCREISLKGQSNAHIHPGNRIRVRPQLNFSVLPSRFGEFGGQFVPESLIHCLGELEQVHKCAMNDPGFWQEFRSFYGYMNRPSKLYRADKLSEQTGGATIWLKREDLCHTGSHKINNVIGQLLLARRMGKTRIIAETGSGQHGVAVAAACARFDMECVVYMGTEDIRRQAFNVQKMRMLGAIVTPVKTGSCTIKDAVNDAMRDLVTNLASTYYLIGSAIGPHPFPTVVRDFQKIIGQEIKMQLHDEIGRLPDAVVACVGGGSNAIGAFFDFIDDKAVKLVGVEAGGQGLDGNKHCATLAKGQPGVFHGVKTYVLQSATGHTVDTHTIRAGLDYPAVGPEHAWLKGVGRVDYVVATDEEALRAFKMLSRLEGIIPALKASHAIWEGLQLAKSLPKERNVVVCLSGGGDKDLQQVSELLTDK